MDRKGYMRDVYSKARLRGQEECYRFLDFEDYDKFLIHYICKRVPKGSKLLEVAIGTGYPIADALQKAGYQVFGVDISPKLIETCREINPQIDCMVGDVENLQYPDNTFPATYCFHSTWYFPDLSLAIDNMLRVTQAGGLVIFDIMNANNLAISTYYNKRFLETASLIGRTKLTIKNIASIIMRRGCANWRFLDYEVPIYPESIYEYTERGNYTFEVMGIPNVTGKLDYESIETAREHDALAEYSRLIFVVRK